MPMTITIEDLERHLLDAREKIGCNGRFALAIHACPDGLDVYITHWFQPTSYAFENCKIVTRASTVEGCLAGLRDYVANYRRGRVDDLVRTVPESVT